MSNQLDRVHAEGRAAREADRLSTQREAQRQANERAAEWDRQHGR